MKYGMKNSLTAMIAVVLLVLLAGCATSGKIDFELHAIDQARPRPFAASQFTTADNRAGARLLRVIRVVPWLGAGACIPWSANGLFHL